MEKNGCFTTSDLASALAYMISQSGPFFTLNWGYNNSSVINTTAAKDWFAASAILLIADPLYLPDLATVCFFLFTKVEQLAGLSFAQESLKKTWVGVSRNVFAETFAAAFRRCFELSKTCVRIGGEHAEKS